MISIRGGMGLGDAVYVQSVARHLVEQGHRLEVCTAWPEVFRPLDGKIVTAPFRRKPIDITAHYTTRRGAAGSTQFEDICITARVRPSIDLRLDWQPQNVDLIETLRRSGKPVIVVQMPRPPFGRSDGFGMEFLPDCRTIQRAIDRIGSRAFKVQIGSGRPLYPYSGIDLDLSNQTTVSDVLDVGFAAHGFLGQCSFIIPIAESFSKPALLVWSRKAMTSPHEVIRQMTPKKILHKPSSRHVFDDCSDRELTEAVDALCHQIAVPVAA